MRIITVGVFFLVAAQSALAATNQVTIDGTKEVMTVADLTAAGLKTEPLAELEEYMRTYKGTNALVLALSDGASWSIVPAAGRVHVEDAVVTRISFLSTNMTMATLVRTVVPQLAAVGADTNAFLSWTETVLTNHYQFATFSDAGTNKPSNEALTVGPAVNARAPWKVEWILSW